MSKKASTVIQTSDTAVEFRNVTKTFFRAKSAGTGKGILKNLIKPQKEEFHALDDVSFTVRKGEFTAYAGPNGAGKSTTMKLLSGILLPTDGEISVLGFSPEADRIALMKRIGVLFGNRTELWWDHPVRQSMEWKKAVWNIPDDVYRRNLEMAVELLELAPLLDTFARELSLGQRLRADIAMLLLHEPELVLLDEPTLGLDVTAKRQMIRFLKTANREKGVTVMVTSHDMDDLEEMADRILMIAKGKIVYDGSFDGLRNLAGDAVRIAVTTENGETLPPLPMTLLGEQNGVFEYEADTAALPLPALLRTLSEINGIQSVEIKKSPIEQVIDSLYQNWK